MNDQVAVVTGASSGIGEAISVALAEAGATVCTVARRRAVLEQIAAQSAERSERMRVFPADLTDDQQVHRLAAELESEFGRVDVLVHSAGSIAIGSWKEADPDDLDRLYAANVRAHYRLTQALLSMLRASRGQIVFINSSAGLKARAGVGQFSATQHAVRALADSLRDELVGDGVRVLSVFPGRTATPRQELLHELEGKSYRPDELVQAEDVASSVLGALTMPRSTEVTDIRIRPFIKPPAG